MPSKLILMYRKEVSVKSKNIRDSKFENLQSHPFSIIQHPTTTTPPSRFHNNSTQQQRYHQHTTTIHNSTHELNIKRMSKRKREILSGTDYIGVKKNKQRYQAQIFINGKHYYPGTYDTPIEAANAYDIAAIEAVRKKKKCLILLFFFLIRSTNPLSYFAQHIFFEFFLNFFCLN